MVFDIRNILGDLNLMRKFAVEEKVDYYDDAEQGVVWCLHCGSKFRYDPAEWKNYKPHVRFLLLEFDKWRAKHKCNAK